MEQFSVGVQQGLCCGTILSKGFNKFCGTILSKCLTRFVEQFSVNDYQSLWNNSQQGFNKVNGTMLSKGLTKFVEKFSARVQQSLWSNSQQGFSKSKVCGTIFSKGSTKFLILDRKRNFSKTELYQKQWGGFGSEKYTNQFAESRLGYKTFTPDPVLKLAGWLEHPKRSWTCQMYCNLQAPCTVW